MSLFLGWELGLEDLESPFQSKRFYDSVMCCLNFNLWQNADGIISAKLFSYLLNFPFLKCLYYYCGNHMNFRRLCFKQELAVEQITGFRSIHSATTGDITLLVVELMWLK